MEPTSNPLQNLSQSRTLDLKETYLESLEDLSNLFEPSPEAQTNCFPKSVDLPETMNYLQSDDPLDASEPKSSTNSRHRYHEVPLSTNYHQNSMKQLTWTHETLEMSFLTRDHPAYNISAGRYHAAHNDEIRIKERTTYLEHPTLLDAPLPMKHPPSLCQIREVLISILESKLLMRKNT